MSLFTPTFFLFLALLLLVSGFLLFYMDMKLREQNQKIKAVADLATTIAQSLKGGNVNNTQDLNTKEIHNKENIELIEVSDEDDDDDADDDDADVDDDDADDDDDDDDNTECDDDAECDTDDECDDDEEKRENKSSIEVEDIKHVFLSKEDVSVLEECPAPESQECPESEPQECPAEQELTEALIHHSPAEQELDTFKIVLSSDLDYKKMTITKLRQLVSEKALASSSDASKLKKPELIKLLEAE